ncbi:MAG: FHA domain-containing protein [Myxococcota bacterium]
MQEYVGIVCGQCDALSPLGSPRCVLCGAELRITAQSTAAHEVAPEEEKMEQARNYVCTNCSSPVPMGHKFCGSCGAPVPDAVRESQLEYFGELQAPGNARLILVRGGEGVEGLSYHLKAEEHVAGRSDGQILFPEDVWLSPKHANFVFRNTNLAVRDEGSLNGVYVRVRGSVPITSGAHFLCGEEVFRLDVPGPDSSGPAPDQTYFYSSPKRASSFQITQVIEGGLDGMAFCSKDDVARIGREEVDLNFPEDRFMSGTHARVEHNGGAFTLFDEDSRNGTYVRISGEHELQHGDYLFLGHQLLRVEMTS